jgi:hypothetical protein
VGTWGTGLYSDDFASDLRTSVVAVCRLPLTGEQLVEVLVDLNPAAREPDDDEYTTFWLVVADQLHRRGIHSPAQERAIEILSRRTNLEMLARLGMTEAALKARERALSALGDKLRAPMIEKARKTLKKPQPLLYAAGDVLTYPVDSRENCYNPYLPNPALANFTQTGWSGCMVIATGRALDFLAWYQIATCGSPWKDRPTLEAVSGRIDVSRADVGTLSKAHAAHMRLELLGNAPPPPVPPPSKGRIIGVVASDISASNILSRWR